MEKVLIAMFIILLIISALIIRHGSDKTIKIKGDFKCYVLNEPKYNKYQVYNLYGVLIFEDGYALKVQFKNGKIPRVFGISNDFDIYRVPMDCPEKVQTYPIFYRELKKHGIINILKGE